MRIFETFRPEEEWLRKYVSYYYLDIADDADYFNEYICYPHFNNTVSIYKSHCAEYGMNKTKIRYVQDGKSLQIFTALRESPLKVTQVGPVFKLAIVFEPFGFNQFVDHDFDVHTLQELQQDFLDQESILEIFQNTSIQHITTLLDDRLSQKFNTVENGYVRKALELFHEQDQDWNLDDLASHKLGISRKQLTRLFQKYIGTSPQKYRSIVRFRQLMNHKLREQTGDTYTALSHQAHYTDQSHFIKACKQLTGLTPSQFFKEGKIVGQEDTFWKFTG